MRKLVRLTLIKVIRIYQKTVSPDTGIWGGRLVCRFYPTCSEYMIQALTKYGVLKGLYLGIVRICSCHPWSRRDHIDPLK